MAEKKNSITERVLTYASTIAEDFGLEVWDVEFVKEGVSWFLRVYIDKETRVNIEDCENVSRALEKVLDIEDFIKQSYYLEVSSPGIERELKRERDFLRFIGSKINIKLYKALGGSKYIEGILEGYADNQLSVKIGDKTETIPQNACVTIRLKADI